MGYFILSLQQRHEANTPSPLPTPPLPATRHFRFPFSLLNGVLYLILSLFGLIALIRSIVNQPTIGPIVLFVGLMLLEECMNFLPPRHYAAFLFGLFPSIAGKGRMDTRTFLSRYCS